MRFETAESVHAFENQVRIAARACVEALRALVDNEEPMAVLSAMKFNQIGQDPLQPGVPLNLIEQVNQTFTYLVTAAAAKALLLAHPESAPFEANLGTASGTDIESVAHPKVAAEVFAAVSPANNQKLKQDIAKVQAVKADHRYVFYCSPGAHDEGKVPGDVRVIRFEVEEITDGKTFPGLPN